MELRYSLSGTFTSESKSGYTTDQDSWPAGMSEGEEPGPQFPRGHPTRHQGRQMAPQIASYNNNVGRAPSREDEGFGAARRSVSRDSSGEAHCPVDSPSDRADGSEVATESDESTPDREHVLMGIGHLLAEHADVTHDGSLTWHDPPIPDEAPVSDNPLFDDGLTAATTQERPDGARAHRARASTSSALSNDVCYALSGVLTGSQGLLCSGRPSATDCPGLGNTQDTRSVSSAEESSGEHRGHVQQTANSEATLEHAGRRSDHVEELQNFPPAYQAGMLEAGAVSVDFDPEESGADELGDARVEGREVWGKQKEGEEEVLVADSRNDETQEGEGNSLEGSGLETDAATSLNDMQWQRQSRSSVLRSEGSGHERLVPWHGYIQSSTSATGHQPEPHGCTALEEGQPQSSHSNHVDSCYVSRVSQRDSDALPLVACNTGDGDLINMQFEPMSGTPGEGLGAEAMRKKAAFSHHGEDDANEVFPAARTGGEPGGFACEVEGFSNDTSLHSEPERPHTLDVAAVAWQDVPPTSIPSIEAEGTQEFALDSQSRPEQETEAEAPLELQHDMIASPEENVQLEVDEGALHQTKGDALASFGQELDGAMAGVVGPAYPHAEETKTPSLSESPLRSEHDLIRDIIHLDVDARQSPGDYTSEENRGGGTARGDYDGRFLGCSAESSEDFEVLAMPLAYHAGGEGAPRCSSECVPNVHVTDACMAEGPKQGPATHSTLSDADDCTGMYEKCNTPLDVATDSHECSQEGSWWERERAPKKRPSLEPLHDSVPAQTLGEVEAEKRACVSAGADSSAPAPTESDGQHVMLHFPSDSPHSKPELELEGSKASTWTLAQPHEASSLGRIEQSGRDLEEEPFMHNNQTTTVANIFAGHSVRGPAQKPTLHTESLSAAESDTSSSSNVLQAWDMLGTNNARASRASGETPSITSRDAAEIGQQSSIMQALQEASAVEDDGHQQWRQGADVHAADNAELACDPSAPVHVVSRGGSRAASFAADSVNCHRVPRDAPPSGETRAGDPSETLCAIEEDEGRVASSEGRESGMPLTVWEAETPVSVRDSVGSDAENVWESEEEEFGVLK